MNDSILSIIQKFDSDRTRLMDILHEVQAVKGYISDESVKVIADELKTSFSDVEQTCSFYHFFSRKPLGRINVYLNQSITAEMMGREKVKEAMEREAGILFGEVTIDGSLGLFSTACIGMNDQEPAALINGKVFTRLTPFRAREIIRDIMSGKTLDELDCEGYGGGNNAHPLVRAMVQNNIRRKNILLSDNYTAGAAIREKLPNITPQDVIAAMKESNLRGRGGAGFPTGLKWDFGRRTKADRKYIICNADEGEPGTFKDRVLLTEYPGLVFEGMTIAGFAAGAQQGILYLRQEYRYLDAFLHQVLDQMRKENLLGKNIAGIHGFNYDIRIQFGAGAYVCGEESALIESMEGKRGEPRDKPPFPVEKGYLCQPTVVNNVETLALATKIIYFGAEWFSNAGTKDSAGTKIISISGDCRFPGIYELPWGTTVYEVLSMAGAENVQAVQVGGPSGILIGPGDFTRLLSFADIATGGSFVIFSKERNLLKDVVINFLEFFIDESCGSCSICRNMPFIMKEVLEKILEGRGVKQDIDDLQQWGRMMKLNRCGLGQTAANPVVTSILNFRHLYDELIQKDKTYDTGFDLEKSIKAANAFVGRKPYFVHH